MAPNVFLFSRGSQISKRCMNIIDPYYLSQPVLIDMISARSLARILFMPLFAFMGSIITSLRVL